ncbi:MAG: large subunit ribosomal protein L21 [Enterobacterales bacterium]|jgi:large subunit ribosomal protein L21
MYAVIQSGGKQHRVSEGLVLKLEKINSETGAILDFDKIVSHGRGKKVKIIKFKRRKHHMKQMGHRQWYTEVKITGISA